MQTQPVSAQISSSRSLLSKQELARVSRLRDACAGTSSLPSISPKTPYCGQAKSTRATSRPGLVEDLDLRLGPGDVLAPEQVQCSRLCNRLDAGVGKAQDQFGGRGMLGQRSRRARRVCSDIDRGHLAEVEQAVGHDAALCSTSAIVHGLGDRSRAAVDTSIAVDDHDAPPRRVGLDVLDHPVLSRPALPSGPSEVDLVEVEAPRLGAPLDGGGDVRQHGRADERSAARRGTGRGAGPRA